MDIDGALTLVGIIGAIGIVIVQQMYPTIPKYIGWPIVGILLIVSAWFLSSSLNVPLGWQISIVSILAIVTFISFLYYWRKRTLNNSKVKANSSEKAIQSQSHREEARTIHKKLVELDNKLWQTQESLPMTEDLQKNPEIKHIMDELLSESVNLGHLVNSREYDEWVEAWMGIYSRFLEFHFDMHKENGLWSRARINSKLREFVNKVKG